MVDTCVGYGDKAILDPMVTVNKGFVQAYTTVALRRAFAKLRKSSVSCGHLVLRVEFLLRVRLKRITQPHFLCE